LAHSQVNSIYLITYVEVMTSEYRDASRKQDGNLRFNVLQKIGRPNRFVVVEAWRDPVALEGHAKAASTLRFRERLEAIETAPYDERVSNSLATKK
jgi:quinol monooxygenase YgiN